MVAPPLAARPSTAGAETSRSAVGVLQVGQGSGWPSIDSDWRCSNTVPHAAHRKSYRGIADPSGAPAAGPRRLFFSLYSYRGHGRGPRRGLPTTFAPASVMRRQAQRALAWL